MKIAILGSRGIPVSYGGFETLAEELSTRLVKRGHEVAVYCCAPYSGTSEGSYKGVKRIVLPTIRTKVLEKPVYAFLSLLSSSARNFEILLMLGISVSPLCFIPRLAGKKVIINIDGLEWQRRKWGSVVSGLLRYEEKLAGVTADLVITDSVWVQSYYLKKYRKDSVYIAYGTDLIDYPAGKALEEYGLKRNGYFLYVSRFEQENNPLLVREAYDEIRNPAKKLVMVGDAPYSGSYIRKVKDTKNPHIIFTGYLFGSAYRELLSNAYCYIQATEVGGTHPALVEAMGAGRCVLANDVPGHREVLRDAGIYYKGREELVAKLRELMDAGPLIEEKAGMAKKIAKDEYTWEKITDEYEQIFTKVLKDIGN
jgi:glycosyltransferase involved in cell wall biosynthesis